jgi:membrane protease YdiL (CAAX protease family)
MDRSEEGLSAEVTIEGATMPCRLVRWLEAAPPYPPNAGDLRTFNVLGLRLPGRATVAVIAVALILLLDYHGRIDALVAALMGPFGDTLADTKRLQAIGRLVLEGLVPLLLVVLVMRDRPSRYGLVIGDRRAGLALADFAAYYAPQGASATDVILTTALEVLPAEFFFRGFLLFSLLRVAGPIAVVLATLPFAFVHLGKPEIETLSTLVGGLLYGWLDWRTGSVLWSGLAHTWILSVAVLAAAAIGVPAGA